MLRKTHLNFAIFIYLILLYKNIISFSIIGIIILLISATIPDIDSEYSKIGRKSKIISKSFKHRGFFHSIIFGIGIYLILISYNLSFSREFIIGYFSHILLDMFNYKPTQILWPFKINHKGFIKTNSFTEKLIFIFLLVVNTYLVIMFLSGLII